jgi:hypothetical protein
MRPAGVICLRATSLDASKAHSHASQGASIDDAGSLPEIELRAGQNDVLAKHAITPPAIVIWSSSARKVEDSYDSEVIGSRTKKSRFWTTFVPVLKLDEGVKGELLPGMVPPLSGRNSSCQQ